jgi:hypothetical protein
MGLTVAFTDLQKLNADQLTSAEVFYRALGRMLARQLHLQVLPEHVWDAELGPNANFEPYVQDVILQKMAGPLVWGLDEVDRLFPCPFKDDVFGLFRSWHEAHVLDPGWRRLPLVIIYATEAHLLISNPYQSPFNVGTRLTLADFTEDQVATLNEAYGAPLRDATEVTGCFSLLGGQPYLTQRGLHELVTQGLAWPWLAAQADREDGPFGDHLRRILMLLVQAPELAETMREVLQSRSGADHASFYRLRSAGVLTGESPREARPRCPLYAHYLERHLL